MTRYLHVVLSTWLLLLSFPALAAENKAVEVEGIYLFEDVSLKRSFAEVQHENFKAVSIEDLNFGPVYSAFWVRLELSEIPRSAQYLQSCFIQADELDVYIPEAGGWRVVSTGDTRPFSARDVPHECYVFDLKNLDATQIYLRTYAQVNNRLPFKFFPQSEFWQHQIKSQFGYGFYFAVLVSMVVYNLFLFLVTRDAAYFHYVGYLSFIALFLAEMSGHAAMHLWPDGQTWADRTPIVFASLALGFGSRYIIKISNAERYAPRIARLLWWCLPMVLATIVASFFKGLTGVICLFITMFFMLSLSTLAIIQAARNHYRPGYVMVVAIGMMVPGAFIYFAQAVGYIEENAFTANILYITSAMEAMILSIALAYRIEGLNQEIEQREQQVSSMRQRFSRQLIQTADNERRALARELHDGLGQGLLAVKNLVGQLNPIELRAQAVKQIRTLIADSRNLARNMHPQQIENLGFATALETMLIETIQPANIRLNLDLHSVEGILTHDAELQLYRIAQECASNIVRHSQATHAEVSLQVYEDEIVLRISDNGIGIAEIKESGIGLFNIQERTAIIGARYELIANQPTGTTVVVTVPKS